MRTLVLPTVNHLICLKCVQYCRKLPAIKFSIDLTKKRRNYLNEIAARATNKPITKMYILFL